MALKPALCKSELEGSQVLFVAVMAIVTCTGATVGIWLEQPWEKEWSLCCISGRETASSYCYYCLNQ